MVRKPILSYIIFICVSVTMCHAQINVVEQDSVLEAYYINFPVERDKPEYSLGDTVAAVYHEEVTFFGDVIGQKVRRVVGAKPRPIHVVRAVVKGLDTISSRDYLIYKGLKVKIFGIEKHYKGAVTQLEAYKRPYKECDWRIGEEPWDDVYNWQNITGLWRVQKFTDNYKVGDIVRTLYERPKPLLPELFDAGRVERYWLKAVVKNIDTNAQTLLLEIQEVSVTGNSKKTEKKYLATNKVDYMGEYVGVGDKVWTKPYWWFTSWQHGHRTNGKEIPASIRVSGPYSGPGCIRFAFYDCKGNKL